MWRELLTAILNGMRQFGFQPQPPCEEVDWFALSRAVQDSFGIAVPNEHLELLAITDGLDWNGLVLFGSKRRLIPGFTDRFAEGLVEANLAYRDNPDFSHYLILGDDGTVVFCADCQNSRYLVLTTVGLSELESYHTCEELLASALMSHRL